MYGIGKNSFPPFFKNFFSLFNISFLKYHGRTSFVLGLICSASFSEINFISVPKHFNPILNLLISLITGISFFVNPKCCKSIFPFVLAPRPITLSPFLIEFLI